MAQEQKIDRRPQYARNIFFTKEWTSTGTKETQFPSGDFSVQEVFECAKGKEVFVRVEMPTGEKVGEFKVLRP